MDLYDSKAQTTGRVLRGAKGYAKPIAYFGQIGGTDGTSGTNWHTPSLLPIPPVLPRPTCLTSAYSSATICQLSTANCAISPHQQHESGRSVGEHHRRAVNGDLRRKRQRTRERHCCANGNPIHARHPLLSACHILLHWKLPAIIPQVTAGCLWPALASISMTNRRNDGITNPRPAPRPQGRQRR